MSTDMDEVVNFNREVLIGMVGVLGSMKSGSALVYEQLIMLKHSWDPLVELFQMLLGKAEYDPPPAADLEDKGAFCFRICPVLLQAIGYQACGMFLKLVLYCSAEVGNQAEGLLVDMTLLPSPRTQTKPEFVPNLQIPGTAPPQPSSERPISIFDNFDVLLEREASQTVGIPGTNLLGGNCGCKDNHLFT